MILAGAKDRLLPASVPFRFFTAACVFHILFWLHLFLGADDLPGYIGGPGMVLAAIHLATLGVLTMTAMGAAFQLLPVATRQPLLRIWPARLILWLTAPGILLLIHGMEGGVEVTLYLGGGAVTAGLLVFAFLTADNLRRAGSLPIMAMHGWLAMAALLGLLVLGLLLVTDFAYGFLADRQRLASAHMVLAIFGFMGLLAFGFSHVLIPMLALSRNLPARIGWLELALSAAAVTLAVIGFLTRSESLVTIATITGLAASAAYLWLMRVALRSRMRKRLGLPFLLIRISWGCLIVGLLAGLATLLGAGPPNGAALFGFLVLVGWLLTFLTGILQRIMPFLATMHAAGSGGKPPLLSELTAERPLQVHCVFHIAALILGAAGIVVTAPGLIRIGAVSGLVGALSFAVFAALVILRMNRVS
jgi:hypothetical protein